MKYITNIEELIKLDDKSIQMILKGIELTTLVYSLKGASEDLRSKFFKNMSVRAVESVENELEKQGAVPLREVKKQQKKLISKANSLLETDKPKIALASDHAGFDLKEGIKKFLDGFEIIDFGANSGESVDYPDTGFKAAKHVADGECEKGILICGSGIGMSIVANKVKGIRAALVDTVQKAELSRQHNNSNILVLPGRFISKYLAKDIIEVWLNTEFEDGRHQRRLTKIKKYEEGGVL